MTEEESIKVLKIWTTNTSIAGGASIIDHVTNPSKLEGLSPLLDGYSHLIQKAYHAVGATPLGDAIPEYAWYSTDVLRLMTWYSMIRLLTMLASKPPEHSKRVFSVVTALIPAVIYELSQTHPDPKDYIAYIVGAVSASFLDKKISDSLFKIALSDSK